MCLTVKHAITCKMHQGDIHPGHTPRYGTAKHGISKVAVRARELRRKERAERELLYPKPLNH